MRVAAALVGAALVTRIVAVERMRGDGRGPRHEPRRAAITWMAVAAALVFAEKVLPLGERSPARWPSA